MNKTNLSIIIILSVMALVPNMISAGGQSVVNLSDVAEVVRFGAHITVDGIKYRLPRKIFDNDCSNVLIYKTLMDEGDINIGICCEKNSDRDYLEISNIELEDIEYEWWNKHYMFDYESGIYYILTVGQNKEVEISGEFLYSGFNPFGIQVEIYRLNLDAIPQEHVYFLIGILVILIVISLFVIWRKENKKTAITLE